MRNQGEENPGSSNLKKQRTAFQDGTSKVDENSGARAVKVDIGMCGRQLADLVAMDVGDRAVHVLRVCNELSARSEDLVGHTDGRASKSVVEVDLAAIERSDDWGMSAALVVDEGDGSCWGGRAALRSWESESGSCEEGRDGCDGGLHVDG